MSILRKTGNLLFKYNSICQINPVLYGGVVRSISNVSGEKPKKYKLLIVGGGTGGCAIGHKFARSLKQELAIIEPSNVHYYQPMFTLVGGGVKDFKQTHSPTKDVLPKDCKWIKEKAVKFDPHNNSVTTQSGQEIKYDYLVVAAGINLDFKKVKGLEEAIEKEDNVVSVYSPLYVRKVLPAVNKLESGTAVFTYPNTPVKCAGAAQKICYLSEENIQKAGKREKVDVHYITSLPSIFGIPKYATALDAVALGRNIQVSKKLNLVEVKTASSEAVFQHVGNEETFVTVKYSLLHVTPPMTPPPELKNSDLSDQSGYVKVNPQTLQHSTFPNVFALGDCTNAPTAKTAAACASQIGVVGKNLGMAMKGKEGTRKYDGYTSCPLVINRHQVILAEFGYDGKILETFPIDQSKPRLSMYWLKVHLMPFLYWNFLVKGMWHGPGLFRKMWRLGF